MAREGLPARSLYLDELGTLLLALAIEFDYLGQR